MRERDQIIEEKERTERQLEESGRVIAQFQGRIAELEQLRLAADTTPRRGQLYMIGQSGS